MRLRTDAIDDRGFFDARYTCDLDNSSPELRWEDPPEGTAGFVILGEEIAEDPAAGFSLWVVYSIPKDIAHLPAGIPPQDMLPNGIRQGVNGFNKLGYYGPCPPRGARVGQYAFRIYALREVPDLSNRLNRADLLARITPHVIETAEILGRYQRQIERAG